MITTIQMLLKKCSQSVVTQQEDGEQALRLATAALLIEVARADDRITEEERAVARRVVENGYSLSPEQARELVDTAERQAADVTSLYPFTRLITAECSLEDRTEIVRMLWEVTHADGRIDADEEHLVRKVAKLLYVPHSRFIQTRLQTTD
jgi:uncharacterized tellurite resistance protein B-like protein